MEFVDYKCLESLLIEGEEMIATEGIGKVLGSLIKGVFSLIMRAFRTIAGIFRNIAAKLKSKKPVNKSSNSNTDKTPNKYDEYRIEQEGKHLNEKFDKEEKENDKDRGAAQNVANVLETTFNAGDEVTKQLIYLMDACSTISNSINEGTNYQRAVSSIENHIDLLEEKFNNFSEKVGVFKSIFEKFDKKINPFTRDKFIKYCGEHANQYIDFTNKCENKLKHLMELQDEEIERPYIEKKGIDIQKLRSPAQMALNKMSSCASKMVKLYNEFNNLLSNAVIVFD